MSLKLTCPLKKHLGYMVPLPAGFIPVNGVGQTIANSLVAWWWCHPRYLTTNLTPPQSNPSFEIIAEDGLTLYSKVISFKTP